MLKSFSEVVISYNRYHDDILMIMKTPFDTRKIIGALRSKAYHRGYEIEIESSSMVGAPFLDIYVFKAARGQNGNMSWRPFVKDSAVHVPLSMSSAHPSHTHAAWPQNEIVRMNKRSRDVSDFIEFRRMKTEKFKNFYMPHELTNVLENINPDAHKWPVEKIAPDDMKKRPLRFITRYDVALNIHGVIHRCVNKWRQLAKNDLDIDLNATVSWRSSGPPLIAYLARKTWPVA